MHARAHAHSAAQSAFPASQLRTHAQETGRARATAYIARAECVPAQVLSSAVLLLQERLVLRPTTALFIARFRLAFTIPLVLWPDESGARNKSPQLRFSLFDPAEHSPAISSFFFPPFFSPLHPCTSRLHFLFKLSCVPLMLGPA